MTLDYSVGYNFPDGRKGAAARATDALSSLTGRLAPSLLDSNKRHMPAADPVCWIHNGIYIRHNYLTLTTSDSVVTRMEK